MHRFFKAILFSGLFVQGLLPASAELSSQLKVEDAFIRALPPSVQNTAAYMTLTNISDETLVLTGASSEIAGSAMIHETLEQNGMMSMQHVMSLELAPGQAVNFEPGGLHIMIMGLTAPLEVGAEVELSLQFRNKEDFVFSLPVRMLTD